MVQSVDEETPQSCVNLFIIVKFHKFVVICQYNLYQGAVSTQSVDTKDSSDLAPFSGWWGAKNSSRMSYTLLYFVLPSAVHPAQYYVAGCSIILPLE